MKVGKECRSRRGDESNRSGGEWNIWRSEGGRDAGYRGNIEERFGEEEDARGGTKIATEGRVRGFGDVVGGRFGR